LARRQHGVVSRDQLLRLGMTPSSLRHRQQHGSLRRLHRSVFQVGSSDLSRHGRLMAAVRACGPNALLSHQSAAELWEIRSAQPGQIEVTLMGRNRRRVRGVTVHRRTVLSNKDRRARLGIPVTSPARTLADLTALLSPAELEAAINEADKLDLIDPERLRHALESMRGQEGASALLRFLDGQVFRLTDSDLERRFLRLVRAARLPTPQTGVRLHGFRADFHWPELDLVVETDGLRYHRTPAQQGRDRRRDQLMIAAGLTSLRFTHAQIRFKPGEVVDVLIAVTARLSERSGAA
jgi:very-short-patch-repair endonuclease